MQTKTRFLVNLGLLSAIAYVLMVVGRVPVVSFLKYDPKDVIIVIGGLIYGPMAAFMISVVVSLVEMITVSDTAWIGFAMNVLSTCTFACTAAAIYKKNQKISGAVIGLIAGGILTIAVMLLWNYIITPIYMNVPRPVVAGMLIPVFLPFNALKVSINGAITMLIYKPVVTALRRAGLIPPSTAAVPAASTRHVGALIVSACVLITCIVSILVLQGVI
jgi:riboflavin transporter FmnP